MLFIYCLDTLKIHKNYIFQIHITFTLNFSFNHFSKKINGVPIQIIYDTRLYQHIQYLVNYQDICRKSVRVFLKS